MRSYWNPFSHSCPIFDNLKKSLVPVTKKWKNEPRFKISFKLTCQVSCAVPDRRRPPARPSSGFLKPSSDDEDSGPRNASMQTSKKSSHPARESASFEKPQQERERDPGKTVTAPQDGPTGNKASASRFEAFIVLLWRHA